MKPTQRITAEYGGLLIVDLQEKLLPKIEERERVIFNSLRLVRGATLLGLSVHATEQYPKGLGPSIPELVELVPDRGAKTTFHCCSVAPFLEHLSAGTSAMLLSPVSKRTYAWPSPLSN